MHRSFLRFRIWCFQFKKWDYENNIFEAAKIPREIFPEIIPSDSIVGTVTDDAALLTGLAAGTIVACGAVDNTCMSLGSCGIKEGNIYTSWFFKLDCCYL